MSSCADLEVQMSHDVFDFLTSVVSVLDTGVCFGNGEQQGGVQSPTLRHAVKLCIHLLQASNLHHKQFRNSEPMVITEKKRLRLSTPSIIPGCPVNLWLLHTKSCDI